MEKKDNLVRFCPCSSGLNYINCCAPFHQNKENPATAEALMRSRFSAYALHLIDYLVATTHTSVRHLHQKIEIKKWATSNTWLRLEICEALEDIVEFKAYFQHNKQHHVHNERSTFKQEQAKWYYLKGTYFD